MKPAANPAGNRPTVDPSAARGSTGQRRGSPGCRVSWAMSGGLIPPRWAKIARDLWSYKTRSLLVVLSIAVGVFAIGVIAGAQRIIDQQLSAAYDAAVPYQARISASPFDDGLIEAVARMPAVDHASARFGVSVRVSLGPDRWKDLTLYALPDYRDMPINRVTPQEGEWPPTRGGVIMERNSLSLLQANSGDSIELELPDDRVRTLRITGTVHDINLPPARFVNRAYGYVSFDTLERWGYARQFNEMFITVAEQADDTVCSEQDAAQSCRKAQIEAVVEQVKEKIRDSGRSTGGTRVPDPGTYPAQDILDPLFLILGALGGLSLFLSGFLVVNTIAAVLAQQIRQIGVMKAVGARTGQIMGLYFGKALIYGLLSLVIAIPLGTIGAYELAEFAAGFLNFDVLRDGIPPHALRLQVAVAVLMPLLAAAYPVFRGSQVTVREAMSSYGLGQGRFGQGTFDQLVVGVQRRFPWIGRPLLISLRNTFRRKARLALTLFTLTLGGAIFIAVFSVRLSLYNTVDEVRRYNNYDVFVQLDRSYRTSQIQAEAMQVPGVVAVETWGYSRATRQRPDDSESDTIRVRAPQADTQMIQPTLLAGRWLLDEDESAAVINSSLLDEEPDLGIGDELVLRIDGKDSEWTVVGIVQSILIPPTAFVNYPYFGQLTGTLGRVNFARIAIEPDDPASQERVARALQDHFEARGYQVRRTGTVAEDIESTEFQFDILVTFLLIMALLMAAVGGMGLMGTMSINVLERTREIGVMRAIGASNRAVMQIVLVEGLLIGLASWLQGSILAVPISKVMSDQVGWAFVDSPLSYRFSLQGAGLWLLVALMIAALASYLPARGAARLTVREVLAYE